MEIESFFSTKHLCNTYAVHRRSSGRAILVNPIEIEPPLFNLLEQSNLTVEAVLLTHIDDRNTGIIGSIERIYGQVDFFAGTDMSGDRPVKNVKEENEFETCGFTVQPIFIPGNNSDSLMYRIGTYLFSGNLIEAGTIEKADESYGRALLIQCVEDTFRSLPGSMVVLPSTGPPTTVETELETNHDIQYQEKTAAKISSRIFFFDF